MKFNLLVSTLLTTFIFSLSLTSTQSPQTTVFASTTATTTVSTPFDSDGHEVQPSLKYYVTPVPSNESGGGGLSLTTRDNFCPPFVVQESTQLSKGLPLRFLPLDNKQNSIYFSSDLNIVFNAATICVQSTIWKVDNINSVGGGSGDMVAGRRYYVRSGGVIGQPGFGTVSSWFRIEKVEDIGYKFVFCPSVCGSCKVVCGDVGVYVENGKRWVVLVDKPLVFTLKKDQ